MPDSNFASLADSRALSKRSQWHWRSVRNAVSRGEETCMQTLSDVKHSLQVKQLG